MAGQGKASAIKGALDAAMRASLPAKKFGLTKKRKYPMPNKSHAANAKGRAKQQYNLGKLSKSALQKIDAKADKMLGEPS